MAAGDELYHWEAEGMYMPASTPASPNFRNGDLIWEFPDGSTTYMLMKGTMPRHYDGGGVTVYLYWSADGVAANNVVWQVEFERRADDAQDTDSDSFASGQTVTATAPSVDGELSYDSIAFTDGAQMDSLAKEERFRLRAGRLGGNGSDTMTADAQLRAIRMIETP